MMVSGDINDGYQTWSDNHCGRDLCLQLDPNTYVENVIVVLEILKELSY
jgi:hypothetical protein